MTIQFVSGRAKDRTTQSLIRSHAMSAFRNKQRQQKSKRRIAARKLMPVERIYDCPKTDLSPSTSSDVRSFVCNTSDSISEIGTENHQYEYGHDTSLEVTQVGVSSLFASAPAQPDPLSSAPHLPPVTVFRYSQEVDTIKRLGAFFHGFLR